MPRVTIPGVGDVQFPDNMSRDEIMSRATAMQQQSAQPLLDARDLPTGELIKGGFSRGIEGLKGTALDLIPALAGSVFGQKDYAREQLKEYAARMAAEEEINPTAYKSYKDVQGFGDVLPFVGETIGELGPDIASLFTGAGLGAQVGKQVVKKGLQSTLASEAAAIAAKRGVTGEAAEAIGETLSRRALAEGIQKRAAAEGARIGSQTGLIGSSMATNVPDVFQSIYEATGSLEPGLALTVGSLVGMLDTYLPGKILQQLGPTGKAKLADELLKKSNVVPVTWKKAFGAELAKTAGGEGLTESAQEALTIAAEQMAGDKKGFFDPKNIDRIITSAVKGVIGGTTYGAPGAAVEAKQRKDIAAGQIAEQEALKKQQEQTGLLTEETPAGLQQVETDQARMPKEVAPGVIFDPKTGTYIQQGPEQQLGRAVNPVPQATQGTPELVGLGAPAVDLAPAQAEMFGLTAYEQPAQTIDQALAGPPEAPAQFKTTLDADTLKVTGLRPQSGFYKQLLNKDMANPEDQKVVAQILTQVRSNPSLSDSTKQAVERVAMNAFGALAEQQEMFNQKGGIRRGADYGRIQPGPVSGTSREGIQVSEQPGQVPTEGTTAPGQRGLAPVGGPVREPGVREEVQQDTLTQEEQDAIQAELAAEMAGEAAPSITAPTQGSAQGVAQGSGQVGSVAQSKSTTKTAATEKLAPALIPEAAKDLLKKAEREKSRREEGTPEFQELARPGEVPFDVSKGYMGFAKQDITDLDDSLMVTDLLQGKVKYSPEAKAAQVYFGKMPRIVDNLINIAYDIVFDPPRFRSEGESTAEVKFFQGMNGKSARLAADWVHKNLTNNTDKQFRDFIRGFEVSRDTTNDKQLMQLIMSGLVGTKEKVMDETIQSYIDAMEADLAAARNRSERRAVQGKTKKLEANAVIELAYPLHPAVIEAVNKGDLQSALKLLAASSDPFVSKMATRLANANLGTKVVVQENLTDEGGKAVPGFFDPQTNTIYLDATTGMSSHVLLHEADHAGLSHVLDNPSHPVTKQLQQLLDKIRDSLGSAYGATDVHEFAAEAQSNPEFVGLLKSINPDGGKYTAWDRFVRTVSNFIRSLVGLPSKPLESAYDKIDRLVEAIISPAPETRDAGSLYAAANSGRGGAVLDNLGDMLEALPGMNQERADNVHEFLKNTVGGNFRSFFLSLLPLNALADVAQQKGIKNAMEVDKLVNQRSGYQQSMNESIEPIVARAEKFAATNSKEQVDLFNDIVYSSTLDKVDPTQSRERYLDDPDRLKAYDEIKAKYDKKLNANGRALYINMRDAYQAMYEQIKKAIAERVNASVEDKDRAKIIVNDIFDKLLKKGNIDPYFPLARYGNYWLSYSARDANGQIEFYVEAFESERARSRAMQTLTQEGAQDIEPFSNLSSINYRKVPSGSFVNSILNILEVNKVPEEATEEVMRLFLNTLPETSFAQAMQRRKETAGFNRDAVRALREKMYRTSQQIATMRYAAKLNAVLDQMREFVRGMGKGTGDDNRVVAEYVKEFEKRISYINNPTVNKWSNIATSVGFNMTLGFNVSSAVINLTQVPLIVMPYLGGMYGYGKASKAIGDAYKVYLNSGFGEGAREVTMFGTNERVKQKAMPSFDNYNFDDPSLPPEVRRLKTLATVAGDQGQLNRSQLFDVLEVDGRNNPLSTINAASGFVFHHGERLNRQVSLIAAYNLELNKLADKIKKGQMTQEQAEIQAANHAVYTTEMTNGGIAAASAPRIAQSSLGKVLFMFKRYGVSMYYLLFKTAREALKGETPEIRKAAMQQIAGIYGSAALFAGVQGLPLFGIAAMVYNLFADDDDDDLETATRKYLGETAYKGLFNYVTNIEIAGRTGLSDLIIRDSSKQDSQTFATTAMEMMGGPVYGVASKIERGLSMIRDGNVRRGIENILPSSLGNIMKGVRYATEGTTTLRGDPITGEVNAWNVGAQIFGFAPADYTRQIEINSREKGIDKKVNQDRTKFLRQYYTASRMGDYDGREEAKQKLLELGAKHPTLGINPVTIRDTIDRSIAAQKRATKEMINGVRYSPKMLKEIKKDLAEYED